MINTQKNMPKEIKVISEKLELLYESSNNMIEVMERQIEAIIASNTNEIEELSYLYGSLTSRYSENEKDFINELSMVLSNNKDAKGIKLLALKELFPDYTAHIEYWQNILQENVKKLQRKHHQIVDLLEFAMNNNARILETFYAKGTEKNKHYNARGTSRSIMPGLAINQQI
jgi:hypothetical protein